MAGFPWSRYPDGAADAMVSCSIAHATGPIRSYSASWSWRSRSMVSADQWWHRRRVWTSGTGRTSGSDGGLGGRDSGWGVSGQTCRRRRRSTWIGMDGVNREEKPMRTDEDAVVVKRGTRDLLAAATPDSPQFLCWTAASDWLARSRSPLFWYEKYTSDYTNQISVVIFATNSIIERH